MLCDKCSRPIHLENLSEDFGALVGASVWEHDDPVRMSSDDYHEPSFSGPWIAPELERL